MQSLHNQSIALLWDPRHLVECIFWHYGQLEFWDPTTITYYPQLLDSQILDCHHPVDPHHCQIPWDSLCTILSLFHWQNHDLNSQPPRHHPKTPMIVFCSFGHFSMAWSPSLLEFHLIDNYKFTANKNHVTWYV